MTSKKVVGWKVYEEERLRRNWVEMPEDYIGTPLYEHATDYISELSDGSRVIIRKSDSFIYPNYSDMSYADSGKVEKMREDARKRTELRRRSRVLY